MHNSTEKANLIVLKRLPSGEALGNFPGDGFVTTKGRGAISKQWVETRETA